MPDVSSFRVAVADWASRLNAEHFAFATGQCAELRVAPIYADHAEWFAPERIREWAAAWRAAPDSEGHVLRRGLQWSFQGYLAQTVRDLTTELAEREAQLTVEWDGETLPVFAAQVRVAREPNAMKRRALHERIEDAQDGLDPLREQRLRAQWTAVEQLGFGTYKDGHELVLGLQYDKLFWRLQPLLRETEEGYIQALGKFLDAHAGTTLADADQADAPFLRNYSVPGFDFPAERLRDAIDATLLGLGLQPLERLPIVLDLEVRPHKHPRAFCVGINIPHDVRLSHLPRGGIADYQTTFHEMGHALHFSHTYDATPADDKYVGDRALSETYAFLLQSFTENVEWLTRVMHVSNPRPLVRQARLVKTYLVRRYVAKLGYEIELHAGAHEDGLEDARETYADALSTATAFPTDGRPAIRDLDDGFYAADYLRAWCLEAQIRQRFVDQFGPRWWENGAVNELLRYWFATGREWSADELACAAGVGAIKSDALVAELCS